MNDTTVPVISPKGKRTKRKKPNPFLYACNDAAHSCGVSSKTWRTWNLLGFTPKPIMIGKTFFWRVDELARWIEADCPKREEWHYRPQMNPAKICPFAADRLTSCQN